MEESRGIRGYKDLIEYLKIFDKLQDKYSNFKNQNQEILLEMLDGFKDEIEFFVKKCIDEEGLVFENVMEIVYKLIAFLESKEIKGILKRQLIIDFFIILVETYVECENDEKLFLILLLLKMLPKIIDLTIRLVKFMRKPKNKKRLKKIFCCGSTGY